VYKHKEGSMSTGTYCGELTLLAYPDAGIAADDDVKTQSNAVAEL
jgi:hypothetical protein